MVDFCRHWPIWSRLSGRLPLCTAKPWARRSNLPRLPAYYGVLPGLSGIWLPGMAPTVAAGLSLLFLLTAVGLTLLFYAPFATPLLALRHRKRAASVFAALTLIAALVCMRSRWTPVLVPHLAAYSSHPRFCFLVVLASAPLGARRREFIQKAVLATLRSDHRAS